LPIPNGASTAQYQLSVEALDPVWSDGVCPYEYSQVAPSGTFEPVVVTVSAGADSEQDILMSGSKQAVPPWAPSETWAAPASVPSPGDWVGSLSGYGDVAYFLIAAQANRTLSVAVTALDDTGAPSESKAAPVVGMWTLGDPQGTTPPVLTAVPFNAATFGMSRLDAQVLSPNSFIIGIADLRGDGRPDYTYHAHVLYGDSVSPPRVPVTGGVITLQGTGFAPGLAVSVGSASVYLMASNAAHILVAAPAHSDGPQNITISDPVSGASSVMTQALTYGAAATDRILLVQGTNSSTPVGTQATNPVTVQVVASNGVTPVTGATVGWTTTNDATLSVCGGISSCSSITDESGIASTWVTPEAAGVANITATLAPGVYSPAQSVLGTLFGTSSSSDIGVVTPHLYIVQGATLTTPITARVVSAGTPQSGVTVDFRISQGSGSLSSASAVTNSAGYASVMLSLTNFTSVQVVACVSSGSPCQTVYGSAVGPAALKLQGVAGASQLVSGQNFQPLTVRVTDSSTPPNPVLGAAVLFQSTVFRMPGSGLPLTTGDTATTPAQMPIVLSASQSTVASDANGLASIVPSVAPFTGLLELEIQVSAGTSAALQAVMEAFPQASTANHSAPAGTQWYAILPDLSGDLSNAPIPDDASSDAPSSDR